MNIHHLLSPNGENGSGEDASPRRARPSLAGGKRTSSSLSQEVILSPDGTTTISPTNSRSASGLGTPHSEHLTLQVPTSEHVAPNFRPLLQTSNPSETASGDPSYQQNHARRPLATHRPLSTAQIESFTEAATRQTRQQAIRAHSTHILRQHDHLDTPLSQLGSLTPAPPIARSISRQSLADLTMAEAPTQTPPPRDFVSNALTEVESKTVTDLLSYLAENSYAYDHHVQLINLLHKGFLAHISADSSGHAAPGDPHDYVLLKDLRQAREAMDTRFAVGEAIWSDWLSDEIILARSSNDQISLMELCQKAVQDEPASVRLWQTYAAWALSCYAACNELEGADFRHWTAEDRAICKELFTKDMIFTLFEQAIDATQWRIDQSHTIWNRYAQMMQEEFPSSPSAQDAEQLIALFVRRLQLPHAQWDETAQMFWPIISRFRGDDWEAGMAQLNHEAEPAKRSVAAREEHELKLQRSLDTGNRNEIQREFERYIKWEKKPKKVSHFEYHLRCSLYERALLQFPTAVEWWLDYVDYSITTSQSSSESLLPLIERATRHCPWSGDLWARRILRADVEKKSRDEIEAIKHRATNAGLLDIGGLEEMVKVLQQWCSFLRRHAFRRANAEDDLDTAEVGITMALEDVSQAGRKLYGKDFQGDPMFRLEQVQIKFYTEGRRVKEARQIYRQIAKRLGNSFDFWSKYYNWELWLWGYDRMTEMHRVETDDNGPDLATAVVQEALSQRNLDWPEKVLEMYLYHFQQHESGTRLQAALVDAREFTNRLAGRRAREAEEAETLKAQQQEQLATLEHLVEDKNAASGEKRKRNDVATTNGNGFKKARTEDDRPQTIHADDVSSSANAQAKRDREHNTISVKNLPADVQEEQIKKFFRDIGRPLSINIIQDKNSGSASATVEFENHEDVLAAKTRNGKDFEGREIRIQSGGQNTLYVCNYPPEYDEIAIRDLFKAYGDIVSVRFPSLKYNNRRRFCYVTFLTPEMAKAAEDAMDDKQLDSVHTLLAKISDPDNKKSKSGPQAEGREVFVKNLERTASEEEVKDFFCQYGTVERLNLLRSMTGQKLGTGFVVYASADEAEHTAETANNKPFHGRILHVEIARPKGRAPPLERAKKEDVLIKQGAASASPEPTAATANGTRRDSDVSMVSSSHAADEAYRTVRERKIAIFNLPDTVNDARIRVTMEKYGPITKIQLRRDREGAIVEFTTQRDAFNVRQGVDVQELGPDASTGDVGDLFKSEKKRKKADGTTEAAATADSGSDNRPTTLMVPSSIGRPSRGGRRGGLGFRSRGGMQSSQKSDGTGEAPKSNATSGKKKNADFRAMLEESKKSSE